jgi:hypothetical protein
VRRSILPRSVNQVGRKRSIPAGRQAVRIDLNRQTFPSRKQICDLERFVERSIASLNRCRMIAKDSETLNRKGLALLRLALIRLMIRKLCNPA